MNNHTINKFMTLLHQKGVTSVVTEGFKQKHGNDSDFMEYLTRSQEPVTILDQLIDVDNYTSGVFNPDYWNKLSNEWKRLRNPLRLALERYRKMFYAPANPILEKDIFILSWNYKQRRYLDNELDIRNFCYRYDVTQMLIVGIFPTYQARLDFIDFLRAKMKNNSTRKVIFFAGLPNMADSYIREMRETWLAEMPESEYEKVLNATADDYGDTYGTYEENKPADVDNEFKPEPQEEEDVFDPSMVTAASCSTEDNFIDIKSVRSRRRMCDDEIKVYSNPTRRVTINQYIAREIAGMTHVAISEIVNGYFALSFNKIGKGVPICPHHNVVQINSTKLVEFLTDRLSLKENITSLSIADLGMKGDYYTIIIKK